MSFFDLLTKGIEKKIIILTTIIVNTMQFYILSSPGGERLYVDLRIYSQVMAAGEIDTCSPII